jgi:hypothetical protein
VLINILFDPRPPDEKDDKQQGTVGLPPGGAQDKTKNDVYFSSGGTSQPVATGSPRWRAATSGFWNRSAPMPTNLSQISTLLTKDGVRHHVDAEQQVIRAVFVTRCYKNLRGERLLVVHIETPDDGCRCRVSIPRAFAVTGDVAAICTVLCRLAADTPLVAAEFDADFEDLRMVVEMVVEDGSLTALQLLSMIDRLVEAAEAWAPAIAGLQPKQRKRRAA